MTNYLIIIVFLLMATVAYSQSKPLTTFPDTISDLHQLVEGTNIYLVPPDSFELSPNFKGFQNPEDPTSMIMITEIPGPFSEVSKGFSADLMATRGMELLTKTAQKVGDNDGWLIEMEQPANGMVFSKVILVFGNEENTTLINGIYTKEATSLGPQITASVKSIYVENTLKADPRSALPYTVDETGSNLEFNAVFGNGMLFNRDKKRPTESSDKATLITDRSFSKVPIFDQKEFCKKRLDSYPDQYVIKTDPPIASVAIDGLPGYELYAENLNDPQEVLYQVILFEPDGGYIILMGTYVKGEAEALADIKLVINSFRQK